jgi:hypothetical protein
LLGHGWLGDSLLFYGYDLAVKEEVCLGVKSSRTDIAEDGSAINGPPDKKTAVVQMIAHL